MFNEFNASLGDVYKRTVVITHASNHKHDKGIMDNHHISSYYVASHFWHPRVHFFILFLTLQKGHILRQQRTHLLQSLWNVLRATFVYSAMSQLENWWGELVSSNIISNAAIQGIDHLFQLVDQMLFSPSHPKGLILKLNKQNSSFESSNKSFLPFCVNLTFTMKGSRPSRLTLQGFKARHEIGTVCTNGTFEGGRAASPATSPARIPISDSFLSYGHFQHGKRVKYPERRLQSI